MTTMTRTMMMVMLLSTTLIWSMVGFIGLSRSLKHCFCSHGTTTFLVQWFYYNPQQTIERCPLAFSVCLFQRIKWIVDMCTYTRTPLPYIPRYPFIDSLCYCTPILLSLAYFNLSRRFIWFYMTFNHAFIYLKYCWLFAIMKCQTIIIQFILKREIKYRKNYIRVNLGSLSKYISIYMC